LYTRLVTPPTPIVLPPANQGCQWLRWCVALGKASLYYPPSATQCRAPAPLSLHLRCQLLFSLAQPLFQVGHALGDSNEILHQTSA
jgi:hypothetical protein